MKPKFNTARFSNKTLGASLVTAIAVCLSGTAMAQTNVTWTGATSTDWNLGTNWNAGHPPTSGANEHAVININSPNVATITIGAFSPLAIFIGDGAATNGRVDQIGGDAATGSARRMYVGRAGGTGVFNLADTTGAGGVHTSYATGSGSMNVNSNDLFIGGFETVAAGGTGTVNVNTTGSLTVGGALELGTNSGNGTLNLDAGTVVTNNWTEIGNGNVGGAACTGTLNMSGGVFNKLGSNHMIIGANGSNGFANVSGGTITTNNELWVGNNGGSHGTLNLSNGTITTNSWFAVGRNSSTATGKVFITGGALNKNGGGNFVIGDSGNGEVTQSAGTVTVNGECWIGQNGSGVGKLTMTGGSFSVNNWVAVGRGGNGTFDLSGGTFTKTGGGNFLVCGNGTGTMNMTGGTLDVQSGQFQIPENGTGTVNLSGAGAQIYAGTVQVGTNGGSTGNLNLNGGSLTASQIVGGGGTANVSFNGTQIYAKASSGDFISNLDTANIASSNGLRVNSLEYNLTAAQAFTGVGGLVKDGNGTLTLTGASSYAGATTVLGGQLSITTDSLATGAVTVNDDTAFGVTRTSADAATSVSDITLGSSGALELNLNVGNFAVTTPTAPLNVTNSMNVNGVVTVNIIDAKPEVGVLPLISYASESVTGSFALGTLPDGVLADPIVDSAGLVSINITRANLPHFDGGVVGFEGVWDIATTSNWINSYDSSATTYEDGDPVVFDDNASYIDVTLDVTVAPGGSGVTFNNTTSGDYTLTGTGKITGTAGLTKTNTGIATISTANDYTGVTTLSGGTLSVVTLTNGGVASPIGAATSDFGNLVFNGGTLEYTGASTTIDRSFTITGGPVGFNGTAGISTTAGTTLTITGLVDSTGGQFVKTGDGGLTFASDGDNFFGTGNPGLSVRNGTLTLDGTGVTQTNTVSGEMTIGGDPLESVLVELKDTGLYVNSWLGVGRGNGTTGQTCTFNATNSTITTGNVSLGYANGLVGYNAIQVVHLTDSTWTNNGDSNFAENSGSDLTFTLSGSSSYTGTNRILVGQNGTAKGNVIIEGTATLATQAFVSIGYNGEGHLTVKGDGIFAIDDDFSVNENSAIPATADIQGNGAISVGGTAFIGRNDNRMGTLTQTGGTFTSTGPAVRIGLGTGSTGVLNLSGGGSFEALRIAGGAGTSNLTIDNGVIKAGTGANANFISALTTATVAAGGVTVDSNGESIAINQALLDGGGGGGLTKIGTGTLLLNGVNTYTGTTLVSAGTLGGTGTVAGPLNVAATAAVAPGASVGTLTAGDTVISGTYACEVDGSTADSLVAGTLDVSAATLDITEINPASGTLIIATYTGTEPAPFATVTGLPAGYTVTYTGGQIALVGGSEYDNWASLNGLTPTVNDGPTQDPEFDGIENSLEFVLGGDPLASDTNILPTLDASGANFIFTFNRADESEAEIGLNFQYGSDLVGWSDVAIGAVSAPADGNGVIVDVVEDTTNPDVITVTVPKGVNTKLFGRLQAVK